MPNKFASAKHSIAECDRCGQRFKLKELRIQTLKTKPYEVKVCKECWDPDNPQLQLGMYPVNDPQAVRQPRPDVSYYVSGNTGLFTSDVASTDVDNAGVPSGGSRIFQWGFNPVGGSRLDDAGLTPNNLVLQVLIGTVTVSTS
jgi:hypothetical protein